MKSSVTLFSMCTSNKIKLHLEVEINGVDQSRLSDIGVDC